MHEACAKTKPNIFYKDFIADFRTFLALTSIVPSTDDAPFAMLFLLLECFLEHTFCNGTLFSYLISPNLLCGLEMTSFQSGYMFEKREAVSLS